MLNRPVIAPARCDRTSPPRSNGRADWPAAWRPVAGWQEPAFAAVRGRASWWVRAPLGVLQRFQHALLNRLDLFFDGLHRFDRPPGGTGLFDDRRDLCEDIANLSVRLDHGAA